jgi:hypothetical protein
MSLTPEEKEAMRVLQLIFGRPANEINELFESVGISAVLSYVKKENIVIPYIGKIKLSYEGDSLTMKGKEAKLKPEFIPSPFLIRNIGQIEDGVETEIEKILANRFKPVFKVNN